MESLADTIHLAADAAENAQYGGDVLNACNLARAGALEAFSMVDRVVRKNANFFINVLQCVDSVFKCLFNMLVYLLLCVYFLIFEVNGLGAVVGAGCVCIGGVCPLQGFSPTCGYPREGYGALQSQADALWDVVKMTTKRCKIIGDPEVLSTLR